MSDLLMCRTCAGTLPKHKLRPLFDRPQLREAYSLSLQSATGLQIKMNDGLPQHICSTCSDTIKNVLRFRKSCETAHKVLVEAAKKKMPRTTVKIEKSADELEKKPYLSVTWNNNKYTIKVEKDERELKNLQFLSDAKNVIRIKNDPEPLTNYVDVELTPMFDDVQSLGDKDLRKGSKGSRSRKIKMQTDKATTIARANKRIKPGSRSSQLVAQYLDESAPLYTCKQCKKCYSRRTSFLLHTQVHTGFKVMCEDCSKVFRNKTTLAIHQRGIHSKIDSNLKCPHCEYYAVSKGYLQVHVRKHTGERPYVCDTCGASFTSRPSLIQHISFHSTEKTIQCEQCPSMFVSRFHLKVHRNKVHRPRKWSYRCPRCPKIYNAIKSCYKHMRNNHSLLRNEQEKPVREPSGLTE